ncbi:hypothetical protein RHSIM_Rhsim03G0101600 [Rhododendron simsii]|uniref:Glutamate synthase domain-containing protein n=1 Tax=Rhododendron simsii TaxID=118357 RepID=A0A834HBV1_RHOSS|nr:hypothetical protein RHSIM_Rhsim03G0101600 [Rhododendron simsii]
MPFFKSTRLPTSSTLSSFGSSLFVVRGSEAFMRSGPITISDKINRFDTTAAPPADGWRAILSMLEPAASPETVVMDGKLYAFGGRDPCVTFAEMFDPCVTFSEMFDPCLISSTSVPLPPPLCWPINRWLHLAVEALQPSKKILVASTDVAFVYNVVDRVWEERDHKVDFSCVQGGQAAVVRNNTLLCWCSRDAEEVHAYDLVLRRHDGGTGASPISSIKHAGGPWELGLTESHQTLLQNGLGERVILEVDRGFKSGIDVLMAAAIGADEYGFGSGNSVYNKFKFLCHFLTYIDLLVFFYPYYIFQREELRARFPGVPGDLVNFFLYVAEEVIYMPGAKRTHQNVNISYEELQMVYQFTVQVLSRNKKLCVIACQKNRTRG